MQSLGTYRGAQGHYAFMRKAFALIARALDHTPSVMDGISNN